MPDTETLASLPTETFAEGEMVLAGGSRSGRLLFLKDGAVEVVKDGVRITRVTEAGAVLGEMSVLLDQPHTADVRALKPSTFHVVEDGKAFLQAHPVAANEVAVILAQRLDALNRYLVDVRNQFKEFDGHVAMLDEVIDSIVNKHPRKVARNRSRGA
ncbi:MAG: cyclic nucleotide-binding domain-containing protein [Pseudomonadota bacterium]